ncbi:hypothetical protein SCLCIDRAFT_1212097 [Scleroderma citrinum Foug A]|uniref:Uncharacterized protein n=1 Tax=Scleroderma citrinum Foug A TaxID=1036808 RepID=A0A0C3DYS6_9AGAM|nr:hypothetical protein SCLCIDRAFT_1212097 [Scleroderma citrinum Foug A]
MRATEHRLFVDPMHINIWDTVGLEEPEMGVNGYFPAIEKAHALIRRLREVGGVNLLLFCIRGNRITTTAQSNYRLFYEVLCEEQVPVGLVITNLEREVNMEDWWVRNKKSIEKYGIKCAGHACVTGLPDDRGPDGKYAKSRKAMEDLLRQHDGSGIREVCQGGRILKRRWSKGADWIREPLGVLWRRWRTTLILLINQFY